MTNRESHQMRKSMWHSKTSCAFLSTYTMEPIKSENFSLFLAVYLSLFLSFSLTLSLSVSLSLSLVSVVVSLQRASIMSMRFHVQVIWFGKLHRTSIPSDIGVVSVCRFDFDLTSHIEMLQWDQREIALKNFHSLSLARARTIFKFNYCLVCRVQYAMVFLCDSWW